MLPFVKTWFSLSNLARATVSNSPPVYFSIYNLVSFRPFSQWGMFLSLISTSVAPVTEPQPFRRHSPVNRQSTWTDERQQSSTNKGKVLLDSLLKNCRLKSSFFKPIKPQDMFQRVLFSVYDLKCCWWEKKKLSQWGVWSTVVVHIQNLSHSNLPQLPTQSFHFRNSVLRKCTKFEMINLKIFSIGLFKVSNLKTILVTTMRDVNYSRTLRQLAKIRPLKSLQRISNDMEMFISNRERKQDNLHTYTHAHTYHNFIEYAKELWK